MNRRFITIAALGLAALALAACGSSDDDATTADTAAAPAASDTAAAPATSDTAAAPTDSAATDTAAAGGQTLTGTVGPGFTITMDQTSVPAGTYTLEVDDQSDQHNFHLTGEGVDVSTTVPEIAQEDLRGHPRRRHLQLRVRSARAADEGRADRHVGRRSARCSRGETSRQVSPRGLHPLADYACARRTSSCTGFVSEWPTGDVPTTCRCTSSSVASSASESMRTSTSIFE